MKGLGGSGHTLAFPTAKSIMQPRIYTYKVTFEEIPDWYWGVHKEKKYDDGYLGSPDTHAWKWEFYTPYLQICQIFPYTDEGWVEAQNVENRCIKPDLNNPLCLNEHCGGIISLEASKRGGVAVHKEKDDLGRSVVGVKAMKKLNEVRHKEKDEFGRSIHAMKCVKRMYEIAHAEKDELGRSVLGVESAAITNSQKWKDPQHPELGEHNPGNLVQRQRARGLPHGKENRVRVG